MTDPWQILGLEPAAATATDVRTAYLRLIKVYRPDIHPQGFQLVRQAYEAAIAQLRAPIAPPLYAQAVPPPAPQQQTPPVPIYEPAYAPPPEAPPVFEYAPPAIPTEYIAPEVQLAPPISIPAPEPEPSAPAPENHLPPALLNVEQEIKRARAKGDDAAVIRAIGHVYSICTEYTPGLAGVQLWQHAVCHLADGRASLVAPTVKTSQLIEELATGNPLVANAVITAWVNEDNVDRLTRLGESILAERAQVESTEAAHVTMRLAVEIALTSPQLATDLASLAQPHLDTAKSGALVRQAEQYISIGSVLASIRDIDQLMFWRMRFRHRTVDWDWTDMESQAALLYLAGNHPRRWQGYPLIENIAPVDWLEQLEIQLDSSTGNIKRARKPQRRSSRRRARILSLIGPAVAVVAFLFALYFGSVSRIKKKTGLAGPTVTSNQQVKVETRTLPPTAAQPAQPQVAQPPTPQTTVSEPVPSNKAGTPAPPEALPVTPKPGMEPLFPTNPKQHLKPTEQARALLERINQ